MKRLKWLIPFALVGGHNIVSCGHLVAIRAVLRQAVSAR